MRKRLTFIISSVIHYAYIVLGVVSALALFSVFFDFQELIPALSDRVWICVGIYLSSVLIAIIISSCKNRKISLKLNNTSSLTIKYGDLFVEKGIIVIPVNNAFDTAVDDRVISSSSLHGMYIRKYFGGNEAALRTQMSEQLQPLHNDVSNVGVLTKYPIGTVVDIKASSGQRALLLALTELDGNNKAFCNFQMYCEAIIKLYEYIDSYANGDIVNIPLLGSGFARLPFSKQDLLSYMVLNAKLIGNAFYGGINIILNKDIKDEVMLPHIKRLL